MIKSIVCIGLSFLWLTNVFAATDVYLSSGIAQARYSEDTDGQNADLTGAENSLSIRAINSLGFLDLGLDIGTLQLSGESPAHKADFDGNYTNITSGVSFSLYPSWIEYYLDVGYRMGLGKLKVQGTQYLYTFNAQMSGMIFRSGIKFVVANKYLFGMNYESKGRLIKKNSMGLEPRVHSANSSTFSLGYRFGGNNVTPSAKIKSGTKNYNDPCRLFGACN